MSDYEIVIHLRDSDEPTRIPLPGVPGEQAEADRETLIYELEQARHAAAPAFAVQTASGHPAEPVNLNPEDVTEVDLIELPADEE